MRSTRVSSSETLKRLASSRISVLRAGSGPGTVQQRGDVVDADDLAEAAGGGEAAPNPGHRTPYLWPRGPELALLLRAVPVVRDRSRPAGREAAVPGVRWRSKVTASGAARNTEE
jgi:hypothetical protein